NNNIFVNNLHSADPEINDYIAIDTAEQMEQLLLRSQLFSWNDNPVFVIRQLLMLGYVIIDDTDRKVLAINETTSTIKIQIPKITYGLLQNYPANVDLHVKKLANDRYLFSSLANHKQL